MSHYLTRAEKAGCSCGLDDQGLTTPIEPWREAIRPLLYDDEAPAGKLTPEVAAGSATPTDDDDG